MQLARRLGKAFVLVVSICAALVVVAIGLLGLTYVLVNKTNGDIESSGSVRKYLIHVPRSYDAAKPAPLVISFHGFAEWPAHQMEISHWNDLADEQGFIVVYPLGTRIPLRWNAYDPQGSGTGSEAEVQFISELIDKLSGEYSIDPSRVYANGLSNGGGMSVLLACRLSARVAAIGSVSGAHVLPWDQCGPGRPVPMIGFHGTEDPIVPYEGGGNSGLGSHFPNVPAWMQAWARRNGCDPVPLELPSRGKVSGVEYARCNQGAGVVFYTVHGGGHAWPGGGELPEFLVGHTTRDVDATRVMWEFFSRHSLPN